MPFGVKKNSEGFAMRHGTDLVVSDGTENIITTTTDKFQKMKSMHEALKKKRKESSITLLPAVEL